MLEGRLGIIHCTASRFGSSFLVNYWHKLRKWGTTQFGFKISAGYHYLVTNQYPWKLDDHHPELDGQIHILRALTTKGAHCRGANQHVGVAFVGGQPTDAQLAALVSLCRHLKARGVIADVMGHDEVRRGQGLGPKSCPGINMDEFRALVAEA